MRILHHTKLLFLIILLTSATFPLTIDGTPAQEAQTDPPDEAPLVIFRPTGPDPDSQPTTRLVTAMDQARERFRQHLQKLTASYFATPDLEQRRNIQLEIRALKLGIETEIMTIQLHHARDLGLDEEADEIAARLAVLTGPDKSGSTPSSPSGEGGGDHED